MKIEEFEAISHLDGLPFIEELLRLEEARFSQSQFMKGSTYEDINVDFGIFPEMATYPVYFAGDVQRPNNKIIFMGINPGFGLESNCKEKAFLESRGLFKGYCHLYGEYRFENRKVTYYSNVAGFLRRLYGITETIDWDWFQEHLITLELIPYHSTNADGLRINDKIKYRVVYFEILMKILRYLNSERPIFINGFPTWRKFLTYKNESVLPEFHDVLEYSSYSKIAVGKIAKSHDFIGVPFLSRPKGGKDAIVAEIRAHCAVGEVQRASARQ